MRTQVLFFVCLSYLGSLYAGQSLRHVDPRTGIDVISIPVELSSEGWWSVVPGSARTEGLGSTYLIASTNAQKQAKGAREHAFLLRKAQTKRRRELSSFSWTYSLRQQRGMPSVALGEMKPKAGTGPLLDPNEYHLCMSTEVHLHEKGIPEGFQREVLAFELAPVVDDGKHWVLFNDGRVIRVEIDPELLTREQVQVTPHPMELNVPEVLTYTLLAQVLRPEAETFTLALTNKTTRTSQGIQVSLPKIGTDPSTFIRWAEERLDSWGGTENRIHLMWRQQAAELYGLDPKKYKGVETRSNPRRRGNTTDMMGVLGGDAAIRETLQLQNLVSTTGAVAHAVIPISEVEAVRVKAHNYEELLGKRDGGELAMARMCPEDRFFVHVPDPETLLPLIDGGGGVLARMRAGQNGLPMDHGVFRNHLARLGLQENWLRDILKTGMLGETMVMLPDLFLTEGTDITAVTRMRQPVAFLGMLKLLGIQPGAAPVERKTIGGGSVFWAVRDDVVVVGSWEEDVEGVLALIEDDGEGSLGASAEFRYMLTQCAPTADTQIFAYFSDPFIRRLTGPALKIGQMRRLAARAELERLSAGDLLLRMDTGVGAKDWQSLVQSGYAPSPVALSTHALQWSEGVATDPFWGRAARMTTLSNRLPDMVTEAEKNAYEQYRNQYERYWRQFFDPIAINVESKKNVYDTTVFVLPLIDSSIYRGFRQIIGGNGDRSLSRPVISPTPIGLMSFNLIEEAWGEAMDNFSSAVESSLGVDLAIWELLGPGVHLGIADSDSILGMGSGELMGLLSPGRWGQRTEMIAIPMIISFLTRPAVLAVELSDPEKARDLLHVNAVGLAEPGLQMFDFRVSLLEEIGDDRWLLRISFEDIVSLTIGLEVQGEYLVLSNLPLSYQPKVTGTEAVPMRDAGMRLNPEACHQTAPAFAAAAIDRERRGTQFGLRVLYALYECGIESVEAAQVECERRFGYRPVHPGSGEFVWTKGGPKSDRFGYWGQGIQPPLEMADDLLPGVQGIDVSMQLEGEGLRTRLRWEIGE